MRTRSPDHRREARIIFESVLRRVRLFEAIRRTNRRRETLGPEGNFVAVGFPRKASANPMIEVAPGHFAAAMGIRVRAAQTALQQGRRRQAMEKACTCR